MATLKKHTQKCGVVIGSLLRGGTETQLAQVLPELKKHGMDVSVFVLGAMGPVAEDLRAHHIKIYGYNFTWLQKLPSIPRRMVRAFISIPLLLVFILKHRKNILHFYLPEVNIIAGMLTVWWHKRVLVSQRWGLYYRRKYPNFVAQIERWVFRKARGVLANSQAIATILHHDGIKRPIKVIYNGLSDERLNPSANREALRRELDIGDDLVFITLGNLHVYKGHAELIQALGILFEKKLLPQNWKLVVIGRDVAVNSAEISPGQSNSSRSQLEKLAQQCQIHDHVIFTGERTDAPALLRIADVGILPSHEEGFSNALIEMMGAGLPIVASDVGGNAEALDFGKAGHIVPAKNAPALAAALEEFLEQEKRLEYGKLARSRVEEHFTLERCVKEHLNYYVSLEQI